MVDSDKELTARVKRAEAQRRYREKHKDNPRLKEVERNGHYKRKYGISIEDYNNKFEEQEGKCAICGTHQLELKRRFVVDHHHDTGAVRSLLCYSCNNIIGLAKESTKTLSNAIRYIEEHSVVESEVS